METSELHVQAVLWDHRGARFAVLLLEGEAPDRSKGGVMAVDALFRVVLARGLKYTTDLDHLVQVPAPGWHAQVDEAGGVTLRWPRHTPLLDGAPLGLPDGWTRSAREHGIVLVFAGYGLGLHEHGLHEHTGNGPARPVDRLRHVAESGALAAGVVPFSMADEAVLSGADRL
jgi:hypothetical protein